MTIPKRDGFYMPAEYAPHAATVMIWCERGGSFPYSAKRVRPIFANLIREISQGETVFLAVSKDGKTSAEEYLCEEIKTGSVKLIEIKTDDCWARDTAPTFVMDGNELRGVDWEFNAWGGSFDGLYADYDNDNAFAAELCSQLGVKCYSAKPFVLEGGSIHSNGKGVVLTTEECLLSQGRNPRLSKEEIEQKLKDYLGAHRVIWLPYGVCYDETNGHVDNICTFLNENTVALGWTDKDGEQKNRCEANFNVLQTAGLNIVKIPFPENPVKYNEDDLNGLDYAEGEAQRSLDDVLAASYINYYVCNSAVLVPQFCDKNDTVAADILKRHFPDRRIVTFDAREIIKGGGNIHCLTQQIPKGKL